MKFHREGRDIIIITLVMILILNVAVHLIFPVITILYALFYLFCLIIIVLVLRFFRVPKRGLNDDEDIVLSAADGVVVAIEKTYESEYFKDERLQVSVFMSIHNVHINWYPLDGDISYYKYHSGSYLIANHPKSSTENERTTVVVKEKNGKEILIRQIAGMVARRIVCYAKENKNVKCGEEMGFIKFGSRVDLYFPTDAKILVKLNEKVKGRITAIAQL